MLLLPPACRSPLSTQALGSFDYIICSELYYIERLFPELLWTLRRYTLDAPLDAGAVRGGSVFTVLFGYVWMQNLRTLCCAAKGPACLQAAHDRMHCQRVQYQLHTDLWCMARCGVHVHLASGVTHGSMHACCRFAGPETEVFSIFIDRPFSFMYFSLMHVSSRHWCNCCGHQLCTMLLLCLRCTVAM